MTERQITNGPKPRDFVKTVERIERCQDHIDAISADAKEKKKPWQQDMQEIYSEADDAGVDVKALKAAIRRRRCTKKAKDILDSLDIAERSNLISIEAALGPFIDTPLGEAAKYSSLEIRDPTV